jgi:hypothetical protein
VLKQRVLSSTFILLQNLKLHLCNQTCLNSFIPIPKYHWTDQINENEVGWKCGMGEERKVYRVLVENPERRRPIGRPRIDGRMGSECILWRLARGM